MEGYANGMEKPSPVGDTGESFAGVDAELEREGDGRALSAIVGSVVTLL